MVKKKVNFNQMVKECLPTTLGCWQVHHDNHHLFYLSWLGWDNSQQPDISPFSLRIQQAINSYADTAQFDLTAIPLQPQVSQFQARVLEQLSNIPSGQTKTYGEVAALLNSHARAVGQACRSNPIQLFIPCHRITSKSGLGGYMGKQKQTDMKQFLLSHEAKLTT